MVQGCRGWGFSGLSTSQTPGSLVETRTPGPISTVSEASSLDGTQGFEVFFFFFFKEGSHYFLKYLFIYLFMAVLGLRFCARAFSSCGKRGPLFIVVCGPLTITASLVAEHRLQTRRLSNCGSQAQPLCGTWDLPRPGLEPVSPALAGRPSTTAPPGKPRVCVLNKFLSDR